MADARHRSDSHSNGPALIDFLWDADPLAPALATVDGAVLRYDDVVAVVERLAGQLVALGVEPRDRVAVVVPNGLEAALVALAVACSATAAPLNPAYTPSEFAYFLADLEVRAAITIAGGPRLDSVAPEGMLSLTLAGPLSDLRLKLEGSPLPGGVARFSGPDDVALVLHTSGTTARPKQVPLTHRNLASSARNVARTLDLVPDDVGMNVMPLFHIHGLVAGLFASLGAGASVTCTPGFDALRFHRWLEIAQPSWFSAVPTMYQLLLARAQGRQGSSAGAMRLVRSSSASMPPAVIGAVEALFGAPFIEAYGMTEAAHQMTANPLPPGLRKPGSVGIAGLTEVRVLREDGSWAPVGEQGEAVIRGECVTSGYVNNPAANEDAFADGWFRTGDLAHLDDDGYLFITGRIKEIINRGGTKISPREIDEVLLGHRDVAQAVAFGVPHRWLGEAVAAAVVLQEGSSSVSEADLRAFAAQFLVSSRVPSRIVIVPEIPKGPTGKLQRVGLAEELGLV
jgi:acyl-CoA synthetase (AMP-forming)/AMP-acid ligase II